MLLAPFPGSAAITRSIDASVARVDGRLLFSFVVDGTGDIILPAAASPGRADGLWRETCFEAFVALGGGAYFELNFSPSGKWAAYRFDARREGMRAEEASVALRVETGEGWLSLDAAVALPALASPALTSGAALNLTAVIVERCGTSYWAVAHPPQAPDFHDPSCFLARLPE